MGVGSLSPDAGCSAESVKVSTAALSSAAEVMILNVLLTLTCDQTLSHCGTGKDVDS